MTSANLLVDSLGRVRETVTDVVYGLNHAQLAYRITTEANPICWLIWHLTRVQDDHIADAFAVPQVWSDQGWAERFGMPASSLETGYGHTSQQVAAVSATISSPELLTDYHDATYEQSVKLLSGVSDDDLERVVDTSWHPPVTLGVRLVSVVNDDMQHAGQAAFLRGILLRTAV